MRVQKEAPTELQPGVRLGPYEIVSMLGAGGMGVVHRARDTRLDRDVAIKVLPTKFAADAERLRRFEREARATAALSHPNILAVYDVGTHEGMPYLVEEMLEGESLQKRLARGRMPVREAVGVALQVAHGLGMAHGKHIVHRDLKPGNLFITKEGAVKILDFGLAKLVESLPLEEADTLTHAPTGATDVGRALGTLAYMAPEQARGMPVDPRADIFSFGCVLYEMLSGRSPFRRDTAADTASAILHEDPPDLEGTAKHIPGPLCQVVRRCLEKRPEDRFTSGHDLAFALEAAAADATGLQTIPRAARRGSRVRTWVATAALLVAVLVLGSLWLARHTGPAPLPTFHPRQVVGQFGAVIEAVLSPSGTEIAYTTSERGTSDLWVTDVRGGKPLRLTERPTQASEPGWFPDGSTIAFTSTEGQSTSIWKVPRFGGAPMLLLQDAAQGAVSPDGTRIAFTRRAEGGFLRIWVATLAAGDQTRRVTGPDDGLFDHQRPAWSPDGRTLCYYDMRDLWLVPADGGKAHPLIKDDPDDRQPVWSGDGRSIYFSSRREGTQALWRISEAGGQPIRVTDGTGSEQSPSLSRDGRRLAFVSRVQSGRIALADLRTGKTLNVQEGGYACLPAIAPDRSALVFVSIVAGEGRLRSLPLRDNAPAGDAAALTDQPGDIASPAFSPDGRWVAYYRAVEGRREIWIVSAGGGPPVDFSDHPGQDLQPVWSPDAAEVAFVSDRGGVYQIWVAPVANGRRAGEPRRVTVDAGTASYPSWSPDGKRIAYVLLTAEGKEVWVAPADGRGGSRRLTSGAHAYSLRWFGTAGQILISGYWGEHVPSLRLLSPETGEARPFALPDPLTLDPEFPDFDLSRDGVLLALFEGKAEGAIWVREAETGSF